MGAPKVGVSGGVDAPLLGHGLRFPAGLPGRGQPAGNGPVHGPAARQLCLDAHLLRASQHQSGSKGYDGCVGLVGVDDMEWVGLCQDKSVYAEAQTHGS